MYDSAPVPYIKNRIALPEVFSNNPDKETLTFPVLDWTNDIILELESTSRNNTPLLEYISQEKA
ncbi:MAG: hypothetical protein IJL02_12135 [Methanobrevibacter sp.]|uniref:hypothetical protein n=1 Tax=Methanobrevibacter sp. TaxID=66852 RepID=UPI0025F5C923|nr:hypothetical protein [Methanobrevibacter sp.]MBQ6100596.1 hypothetical protein [Methanobrevibacter sp.]